ncbi:MAG: hypothetical protein ACLQVJ_29550 [Syntrophobacteraceae bacterium]
MMNEEEDQASIHRRGGTWSGEEEAQRNLRAQQNRKIIRRFPQIAQIKSINPSIPQFLNSSIPKFLNSCGLTKDQPRT